jgi:hypothetical protein
MTNYSLHITPPILWITSWNSSTKYVKKINLVIVSDLVNQKFELILQYYSLIYLYQNLIYLYYSLIYMCMLYFKLN